MLLARETVELLVQAATGWYFEGHRHGLRDREWMALRFLRRAHRFSQTPSALAGFIGATRASASQIVKTLEKNAFLVRKPSREDKRSVMLCLTPEGEKCLDQHDPINHIANAVAALGAEECMRLRNSLAKILNHLDAAHHRLNASICRDCMFLAERGRSTSKGRTPAEFMCRLYRAPISPEQMELLCTSFERAGTRAKIDEHFDKPRVVRQR
jgi:DNA-binding MarR family transcriptional regulator